jgi:integrase
MPATNPRKNPHPRYLQWIPIQLQELLGKAIRSKLLTGTPASEAAAVKRAMRVADDKLFKELKALSPERKAEIVAAGGYDAYLRQQEAALAFHREAVALLPPAGELMALAVASPSFPEGVGDQVRLAALARLPRGVAAGFTVNDLFEQWVARTQPKKARNHARAAKQLAAYLATLGIADYRDVKQDHLHDFPEWLVNRGVAVVSANKSMDYVGGLFAAALPKPLMVNPARGVRRLPEPEKVDKLTFKGWQLAMLFNAVAGLEFGKPRSEEVWWILRLCLFTGCRPNEAAQLQRGDIYTEDGVQVIHFRQSDAVTGKRHPDKSIKTSKKRPSGAARQFPLPPSCGEFYAWAIAGAPDEFVFAKFPWKAGGNGRAAWLMGEMRGFLDALGITDRRLTLYCLRHTFVRARRRAGVSQEIGEILDGHRRGMDGYGDGIDLSDAFAAVCKIEAAILALP